MPADISVWVRKVKIEIGQGPMVLGMLTKISFYFYGRVSLDKRVFFLCGQEAHPFPEAQYAIEVSVIVPCKRQVALSHHGRCPSFSETRESF